MNIEPQKAAVTESINSTNVKESSQSQNITNGQDLSTNSSVATNLESKLRDLGISSKEINALAADLDPLSFENYGDMISEDKKEKNRLIHEFESTPISNPDIYFQRNQLEKETANKKPK